MEILISILRRIFWKHHWVYPPNGNPFRRTCSICGQHQEFIAWDWKDPDSTGWWEAWSDGDVSKHWSMK